ncbi:hypothetical protein BDN72DRAFT_954642 [Pluteus cervinus]|uniref:Uncharacterized protein n=1 Tax=Pluteus cervinus TaxID=181527 RepID=A0ACD3BE89_9AGAR|nr:hypothetical protein BDN72DRAFT_954642 [Pluteus cervinus]
MTSVRRSSSLRILSFGSSKRATSPGPPSPTFSEATQPSQMGFGADGPNKIITRADLKTSLLAFEELINTSANYRAALLTMSKATAAFADAMEKCSSLKGPSYETGSRLQASSGLHHLMGNHYHVLAEALDKNFEKPLHQHLDTYRATVNERSAAYDRALKEKSQTIRLTEMRNLNRKQRNLQSFREALAMLQRQVDELDELKAAHYQSIMEHEEEVWDAVQGKVCVMVRSTLDVFDKFTAKASDPVIEPMLQSVPDPFDAYGPPKAENQIFSILAPLSIMPSVHHSSTSPSPLTSTPERDGIEGLPTISNKNNSWLPSANTGLTFPSEAAEWATFSSPTSSPPKSTSPPTPTFLHRRQTTSPVITHTFNQQRNAENKLRSVLSVIDESRPRHDLEDPSDASASSSLANANGKHPQSIAIDSDASPNDVSDSSQGNQSHDDSDDAQLTPRHSMVNPEKPPVPPDLDTASISTITDSVRPSIST